MCGPILGFPKAIDEFLKSNAAAITLMTRTVIAGADPMLYSCGRMGARWPESPRWPCGRG